MVRAHAPAAAVIYDPEEDVDAPLAACVAALEAEGVRVGGLLQRLGVLLTVLPSRETIRLDDPRGPGVLGCTLDADALTRAAMALRVVARGRVDLLVVSRFGKEEAAGGGWRAELAEALLGGLPVIIGVRRVLLPAWQDFLGPDAPVLPPDVPALLAWLRSVGFQAASAPSCAAASIAR